MSAEQIRQPEEPGVPSLEPVPDDNQNWVRRVGGLLLECAKVIMLGGEYTDHQTEDRKHLKIVD